MLPNTLHARLHTDFEHSHNLPVTTLNVACDYGDGPSFILAQDIKQRPDGLTAAIIGDARTATNRSNNSTPPVDADELLTLYDTCELECLNELRGAWALIIVDPGRQRILVATDRMGRQPLYYHVDGGSTLIGSSLDSIRKLGGIVDLDAQALYQYLYFHMIPAPAAVMAGCQKLGPATALEITTEGQRLYHYWSPSFQESRPGSKISAYAELRTCLRTAVARCASDVAHSNAVRHSKNSGDREPTRQKVGAFLSGGLDSSTVAGILSELQGGGSEAYAIGFDAQGYDEMPYARITAAHFGLHLHERYVTPDDVVEALPKIATAFDEPFGNSSALPAYFCARMAVDDGVDVLLAGDGGDELFAGNMRYAWQTMFEHYCNAPQWLRTRFIEPALNSLPQALPLSGKARSFIRQANTVLPDRLHYYSFLEQNHPQEVFSDDFLEHVDRDQPLALLRQIYHQPVKASALNRMLYLDWQITLSDNDLRKVSQACELAGVTVRYPMLDDELVTFSTTIPSAWKLPGTRLSQRLVKGDGLRHFYKQALSQWLPKATLRKHKHGFGLPFGLWMKTHKPLQELAYDNIVGLKARGFFKPEFLDRAITLHRDGHAAYFGELIWILMSLELWLQAKLTDYRYTGQHP